MKCILILSRDGQETLHRFDDVKTLEEAKVKSEVVIQKEWRERQAQFPFTEEFPAETTLFCESFTWGNWKKNGAVDSHTIQSHMNSGVDWEYERRRSETA